MGGAGVEGLDDSLPDLRGGFPAEDSGIKEPKEEG